MQKNQKKFVCIGAIHEDYNMMLEYEKLNNRTNPVLLNKTLGGVAYNLAKYLRIYSNNIELKSLKISENLISKLKKQKIVFSSFSNKKLERFYISVLSNKGKMVFGLANTSTYENFELKKIKHVIFNESIIALDLNFSKKIIKKIILQNFNNNKIMVCGTSSSKIHKIKNVLDKINFLILNKKEFLILTKSKNIMNGINFIKKKNKNLSLVITNGRYKVTCLHKNNLYEANTPKIKVKNDNGAGDALSAVFLGEMCLTQSIRSSLKKSIAAGTLSAKGKNIIELNQYKKLLKRYSKNIVIKNNVK